MDRGSCTHDPSRSCSVRMALYCFAGMAKANLSSSGGDDPVSIVANSSPKPVRRFLQKLSTASTPDVCHRYSSPLSPGLWNSGKLRATNVLGRDRRNSKKFRSVSFGFAFDDRLSPSHTIGLGRSFQTRPNPARQFSEHVDPPESSPANSVRVSRGLRERLSQAHEHEKGRCNPKIA